MQVSWFRGAGGEMVRVYVSPLTYLSALPIAVIAMALTAVFGAIGKNAIYIAAPVLFFFYALVIMRVAIPASKGKLDPSNDFGEMVSYAGRYAAVTVAWLVPVATAAAATIKYGTGMVPLWGIILNPRSLHTIGFSAIILFLLFLLAAFLPTLSLLVVLRHQSLRDVFSKAAWQWLLVERQEDLVPFYSLLFGAGITMTGVSLIPAAVVVYFAFQVSLEAGGYVSGFLYAWVSSTVPILSGLMAGAFVAAEASPKESSAPAFTPYGQTVVPRLAGTPGAVAAVPNSAASSLPPEQRPDVRQIEQRLSGLPEEELPTLLTSASAKEEQAPILAAVERTLLLLRLEDRKGAMEAAATGANLAVRSRFPDVAVFLFLKLGEDRMRLSLEPEALEQMGKILEQRLMYMDAAWCYHTAGVKAGDLLKAQKRLFQTAEAAVKEGKLKEAQALYQLLLKKYPESTLKDFARQGLERVRNLLATA